MHPWLFDLIFSLNRWLHIVATGLLLGGILFFKFVVPLATSDLKDEQQSAVFGRARWAFRRVVWFSAITLLLTGLLSLWRVWPIYREQHLATGNRWLTSAPWSVGHLILGAIGFALAFRITAGRRLLDRPVGWLGINLIVILTTIFLACVARHWELQSGTWGTAYQVMQPHRAHPVMDDAD